jgi:hypothetical protein
MSVEHQMARECLGESCGEVGELRL